MPEEVQTTSAADIGENDIVFECPYCTKSLAIDYRGAGLVIVCPDCENRIQVPIPDGMEVSDLDATREQQGAQIGRLREALIESQTRVRELEGAMQDLTLRRNTLEQLKAENEIRFEVINREVDILNRALHRIAEVLSSAAEGQRKASP